MVSIAFYLDSDGGTAPGWYIDNVLIQYTVTNQPPVATAATNITQSGFRANWNAATNATGYRLDVSGDASFNTLLPGYADLAVSAIYKDVSGLDAGTTYYYRVRAVYAGGTSDNSNVIAALTLPPNPVANSASSLTAISFQANWNTAQSATSYRLDVSANDAFSSFLTGFNNLTVTELNKSVTSLLPGTYYYYRVRAVNASGTSGNSNVITVRTPPAPPKPPQNLAIDVNGNDIHLSWDAVTQSIINTPLTPDYYLVFSSADPYADFAYLGAVQNLDYTHVLAANFGPRLFYKVYAYKYYDREGDAIAGIERGMSETEVFRLLNRQ